MVSFHSTLGVAFFQLLFWTLMREMYKGIRQEIRGIREKAGDNYVTKDKNK